MPEEAVIILVIVVGLLWVAFKILGGLVKFIEGVSKSFEESTVRRSKKRFEKARDKRREYVNFFLPNELDTFDNELRVARIRFEQIQGVKWKACPGFNSIIPRQV